MRRLLAMTVVVVGLVWVVPGGAITGGTPDGENHPYVAFVRNTEFACTAAAVSPTVLVTAAHCFTFPQDQVWVTFNTNRRLVSFPAGFLTGTWFAHPEFCQVEGCGHGLVGFDSHDVAVIVLDVPVMLPRYAQLPSLGQADTLPNGSQVDILGYGVEDFVVGGGKPTPAATSGLRNIAPADIIPGGNGSIRDEYLKLSANHSQDKGGSCLGDSGGPNLLAGTDTILAINSLSTNGCKGVTYSNRVDIDYALAFINGFLDD